MKVKLKNSLFLAFIVSSMMMSFSTKAQEGAALSKFAPGFYYDKQNQKVEGLIKYVIASSAGVEKIKAFKFKEDEESDAIKLGPKKSNGFGLNGSERVYHTIYKNGKAKAKNKGGTFARVYIGGESVAERSSVYYPIKKAPSHAIVKGEQYLSTFIVRSNDDVKLTSMSLIASKYKKVLKTFFSDCPAFQTELAADKDFLKIANLPSIIDMVNNSCK